jgi:hypothetical protein
MDLGYNQNFSLPKADRKNHGNNLSVLTGPTTGIKLLINLMYAGESRSPNDYQYLIKKQKINLRSRNMDVADGLNSKSHLSISTSNIFE